MIKLNSCVHPTRADQCDIFYAKTVFASWPRKAGIQSWMSACPGSAPRQGMGQSQDGVRGVAGPIPPGPRGLAFGLGTSSVEKGAGTRPGTCCFQKEGR